MKINPTRILLIEDNLGDARLVEEALREAGAVRFKLDRAEDLAKGMESLRTNPPGALLLDLNLPDSTGLSTLKKVHNLVPQIPIILLTGQEDEELANKAVREGAQDYIAKGQMSGSLLARAIRYAIERNRVKNELAESERHYRDLFENAVLAAFQSSPEGKVIAVNQAFARMFGYASPEEVYAQLKNAADAFADPGRRIEILRLTAENPDLKTFENLYRRKDGSTFPGNLNVRPIKDIEGRLLYLEGFIEDLTERKRLEQAVYLMSDTQQQIAHLDSVLEIFQLVGNKVQELIGDGYVCISALDEQVQSMKIVGLYGFGPIYDRLVGKFKVDVSKMVVPVKDMTGDELAKFRSGRLEKFEGGLYRLSIQKVPKRICAAAEKELGLMGIYTMGFAWQNLHYGGITILAKSDIAPFREMIETIMHQATVAMKRIQSEEALQKTKDYWRSLVENTSDLVTVVDANALILYQNPAVEQILGYTPDELIGKNAAEFVHPEDLSPAWDMLAGTQATPGSKPPMVETRFRRKDGAWRTMEMTGMVTTDEAGRIVSVLNSRDITERKQAEQALQISQARFRGIFDNTTIGFYQTTPEGRVLLANPALLHMLGYESFEDLARHNLEEQGFEPNSPRSEFRQRIEKDDELKDFESVWMRTDNTTIHVRENARVVRDEGGKMLYYEGTVDNITERKQAEKKLQESEELFRSFIEQSSEGAILLDEQGSILAWNQAQAHITGIPSAQAIGAPFWDIQYQLLPPERRADRSPELFKKAMLAAFRTGKFPTSDEAVEVEVTPPGGETRTILQASFPIKTETGFRVGSIVRDISERKRAEKTLRESEEHYRGAIAAAGLVPYRIDYENKRFTFIGENILELTGYPAEEFTPDILREIVLESHGGGIEGEGVTQEEASQRFLSGGIKQWGNDLHIRTRNGEERWISDVSVPLSDKTGRVTSAIGIFQDLTKRKQMEELLRESEERYKLMFESAPLAINITSGTEITYANPSFLKMLGFSNLDELKSLAPLELFTPESRPQVMNNIQLRAKGVPVPNFYDVECLRKDGTKFPIQMFLTRTMFADGPATVGFILDISERRQAEVSLRENQARLDLALQSARMGVWHWNITEDRRYFDEQACHLLGLDPTTFSGSAKEFFASIHPDDREDVKAALDRTMTEDVLYDPDYRVIWPDKSLHYITARGRLVRDGSGQPARINGLIWDITGSKQAELEMARQAEEIARLYRAAGSLLTESPFDLPALARTILKIVLDEFGQSNCSLFLVENDTNKLIRIAAVGPYTDQVSKVAFSLDGPGLVPSAIRSGNCINTRDVRTTPAYVAAWDMARSELTIPLKVGNNVIGAIDVQSALASFFSVDDERLMTIFAERAALALEHARLYTQTERRLENLTALRVIDTAIASSFDIRFTLGILLDQVAKQLGIETANIMIFNPNTQTIQSSVAQGFRTSRLGQPPVRFAEHYARQVVRERRTIAIDDLTNAAEENPGTVDLVRAGITAYLGVPLVAKGLIKGVLEVYQSGPISLDQEQRSFLDMLAGQAAIAIDSAQLFETLQGSNVELMMAYDETIEGWSQAMDLRDKETEGHSRRVTETTVKLAASFGSSPDELIHIRRGALLHDIGKLGVPDEILRKPGPLTEEEWEIMRKHPQAAYDMLAPITYLHPALDIPFCHHEKWDGSGYPRGLKGNQIPLAARIFAVADVWDALTSDRPYREAWSREKAIAFIQEQSGKHFDPGVVNVFIREIPDQR